MVKSEASEPCLTKRAINLIKMRNATRIVWLDLLLRIRLKNIALELFYKYINMTKETLFCDVIFFGADIYSTAGLKRTLYLLLCKLHTWHSMQRSLIHPWENIPFFSNPLHLQKSAVPLYFHKSLTGTYCYSFCYSCQLFV